jgi:V8-like Glu-specific endopeptidase
VSMKIVHTFGHSAGLVQTLAKDVIRFGRTPDNDVVFDANYDRDASGNHAELRLENGRWTLVDLKSRNGTYLRGQRVTDRAPLTSGDEVTFGLKGPRVRLEFTAAAPQIPAAMPASPAAAPPPQRAMAPSAPVHAAPAVVHAAPAVVHAAPAPVHRASPPLHAPPAPAPPAYAAPQPPRPHSAPLLEAPAAGKRVGQRTMAVMISSAVDAVRGRGPHHSTQELSAHIDRQVDAATAGQKRTTILLAVLLVGALAGLGGLILWSSQSSEDIDKLRSDLAKLTPDDPRRKEIEGRLGSLHPSNASFGRNLYDRSKKGIFMLAAGGEGFCTAFAVRPNVLATNAHCVFAARRHVTGVVALENEGRAQVSYSVSDMKVHPGYRDSDPNALTPDVGIVTISGKSAVVLELAARDELTATGAGDDVYMIGFPGRLMDASNPAATFLAAHIGRITNASGRPGAYADNWLIQHDAPTTAGTSGSPIFNGRGKVVGINAGGYLEGDDETIAGKKTEVVKASPYKFGMRIDLLDAILR